MYKFSFKRNWFWRSFNVIGHAYAADQNKMVLYFEGGGIQEIKDWKNCEVRLGIDWVIMVKSVMEQQVGQAIPIKGVK
jgi:hypothetical protein